MADETKNALIQRPGTGLAGTGPHTSPVIARMTRDVLARAKAGGVSLARFRIGEYLLREPDYRQMLRWAAALEMAPEALLTELAACRLEPEPGEDSEPIGFAIENGAIVNLAWSFDRLPLIPAFWEPGLLVHTLGYRGKWPDVATPLRPVLLRLQTLVCRDLGLKYVDLSQVPGLTELECGVNELTELELLPVPGLTKLYCWDNELTQLDLTPVPGLTELSCSVNLLPALDLSPLQGLSMLDCGGNDLTELDLSPVPGLTALYCWGNQITELDLTPVPGLTKLQCWHNQLTELDLNLVPGLTQLWCRYNQLTELDLSPVPGLTELHCDEKVRVLNAPANLSVNRL